MLHVKKNVLNLFTNKVYNTFTSDQYKEIIKISNQENTHTYVCVYSATEIYLIFCTVIIQVAHNPLYTLTKNEIHNYLHIKHGWTIFLS